MQIKLKTLLLIGGILVFCVPIVWYFFFYETDESRVRGKFVQICELVRKDGETGLLDEAGSARRLGKLLDPEISLELPRGRRMNLPDTMSREDAIRMFFLLRKGTSHIRLDIQDLAVEFLGSDQVVTAFTATLTTGAQGERPYYESRRASAHLVKSAEIGDWVFVRFELLEESTSRE